MIDPDTGGLRTPLFDLHTELGGRMVNFGGHALPMRYGDGTVAEHRSTRTAAGLFDVSHMGIVELHPAGTGELGDVATWLEQCAPGSIVSLAPGRMRYTLFTTAAGGVLDDLIVSNLGSHLRIVINAVRTGADLDMLRGVNGGSDDGSVRIRVRTDVALLALQGPAAAPVLARWVPAAADLAFMSTATLSIDGVDCEVSRCGYTGEDGFEIAMPSSEASHVAQLLLGSAEVAPAGLGARDTLRLEAGLPLVGHELTETTTPAEAGLGWSIPKRRRAEGGFPGADVITAQLTRSAPRQRVGVSAEGRRPIRDGAVLADASGNQIGMVTSGGFGPTVDAPVAMAYVATEHSADGTEMFAEGRKGPEPCRIAPLPFTEHRYWRPT
ncbi:glycine cleavage system aminomethyltransferase GcvT [Candidatus Poriferisodalis sp.]|uniref:glycine cleavage system aminomethyltransferase GcvT n=1 Tax=Candidatus Poriferisodalis sp. TaxID=3101277 RepID=UPI003B01BB66